MFRIMYAPKIIHQMWLDTKVRDNTEPPEKYRKLGYSETFKQLNPEFEYKFWNWEMVDKLFENPLLTPWKDFFYNGITRHIEKCDFARFAVLYIYGGVYVDLDFKCLKPLYPYVKNREFGCFFEPPEHIEDIDKTDRRLCNGFLISSKGHWIWPKFLDYIKENYTVYHHVILNTGPAIFSHFEKKYHLLDNYPHYFLDTCLFLPFIDLRGGKYGISKICPPNPLDYAVIVTFWNEGSGWGQVSMDTKGSDDTNNNNKPQDCAAQSNETAIIVISVITAILILALCIILFFAKGGPFRK